MKIKRAILSSLLVLLAGFAIQVQAMAAGGYVAASVHLRAGPDIGYPSILLIPAGAPVRIEGCTAGWAWCDVAYGDARGWVAGNFILDDYSGRTVMVSAYGARLGIPVVSFSIVTYWGSHYTHRPFYRERERWYRHPQPHHAPPPPPRHRTAPPSRSRSDHERRGAAGRGHPRSRQSGRQATETLRERSGTDPR